MINYKNCFCFGFNYIYDRVNPKFLKLNVRMKKQVLNVEELLTEITKPFNNPEIMSDYVYKRGVILKYIGYYKKYYREEYKTPIFLSTSSPVKTTIFCCNTFYKITPQRFI